MVEKSGWKQSSISVSSEYYHTITEYRKDYSIPNSDTESENNLVIAGHREQKR